MNIFRVHDQIISDYKSYIESFLLVKDQRIKEVVDKELDEGRLWPEPLIQFNPTFKKGTSVNKLIEDGIIASELNHIFYGYDLYRHQVEAIKKGVQGKSFTGAHKQIVTSSKLSELMLGKKTGDAFDFGPNTYSIIGVE